MLLNKEQVMQFLPHRDPFLFIDSVDSVVYPDLDLKDGEVITAKETVNSEVVAQYRTKEEHPIFEGHFPGNPVLPGVVQIEMMAQAAAFGLLKTVKDPSESNMEVALISVSNAKFRKPIGPGMDLIVKSKCIKCRGPFATYECQLLNGETLMSEATVMATVKL